MGKRVSSSLSIISTAVTSVSTFKNRKRPALTGLLSMNPELPSLVHPVFISPQPHLSEATGHLAMGHAPRSQNIVRIPTRRPALTHDGNLRQPTVLPWVSGTVAPRYYCTPCPESSVNTPLSLVTDPFSRSFPGATDSDGRILSGMADPVPGGHKSLHYRSSLPLR